MPGKKSGKLDPTRRKSSADKGGQLFPVEMVYNGVKCNYSARIGTFGSNGPRPKSTYLRKGK